MNTHQTICLAIQIVALASSIFAIGLSVTAIVIARKGRQSSHKDTTEKDTKI